MNQIVKKYSLIYYEFFRTCLAEATSFRLNFAFIAIMDLLFYAITLAGVDFLFQHVEKIGVWNRSEFLFFISFMLALDHLHMTYISESFWELSFKIRQGTLDFTLVKPVNSIFDVFFRHIRPATIPNALVIWSVLIYHGLVCELSMISWLAIPVLMLCALALLVLIEITLCVTMFWTIESFGINFIRMQFQALARWPDFIYRFYARKFFTVVVPLLTIGSAPVHFLLDPYGNFDQLLWLLATIVVAAFVVRISWNYGLRSYESASS